MRRLTFRGYLTWYLPQLAGQRTLSVRRLTEMAASSAPRLREPLFLYALYTEKLDTLLSAAAGTPMYAEYLGLTERYTPDEMTDALMRQDEDIPVGYRKVWTSYLFAANRTAVDNDSKNIMRNRIRRLQEAKHISNYRIYTDLGLNRGNVNAWLSRGDNRKVGLDTARRVLAYVREA